MQAYRLVHCLKYLFSLQRFCSNKYSIALRRVSCLWITLSLLPEKINMAAYHTVTVVLWDVVSVGPTVGMHEACAHLHVLKEQLKVLNRSQTCWGNHSWNTGDRNAGFSLRTEELCDSIIRKVIAWGLKPEKGCTQRDKVGSEVQLAW